MKGQVDMSKKFLKAMVVATTICLTLLGTKGIVWSMWQELDDGEKKKVVLRHLLHNSPHDNPGARWCQNLLDTRGAEYVRLNYGFDDCPACKDNLNELRAQKDVQNRLMSLEDTVKDPPGSTVMLEKMNEEIQWLKNELRSIQQLVPSLFPRDQEEQIKTLGVVSELKNLEEEPKVHTIFHTQMKPRRIKEEKKEIAKKLIAEQMSDKMVLKITGLTIYELGELKGENIQTITKHENTIIERPIRVTIPEVARGYKEIYKRFLKGVLIYRPQEGSDMGKIEMPIADLANPLEGTFDLSKCGDTGNYLSISTGYRKEKKAENVNKVEVWLTPRFLIEKEIQGSASHFTGIIATWDTHKAPFGVFFTWGGWDDLSYYHYATQRAPTDFPTTIWAMWVGSKTTWIAPDPHPRRSIVPWSRAANAWKDFMFIL